MRYPYINFYLLFVNGCWRLINTIHSVATCQAKSGRWVGLMQDWKMTDQTARVEEELQVRCKNPCVVFPAVYTICFVIFHSFIFHRPAFSLKTSCVCVPLIWTGASSLWSRAWLSLSVVRYLPPPPVPGSWMLDMNMTASSQPASTAVLFDHELYYS